MKFNVAIVGATGAVGEEIIRYLKEYKFPINNLYPLCSINSAGCEVEVDGEIFKAIKLDESFFQTHDIDIAFFSAGSEVSKKYVPLAAESGAVVIDNTSYFRMNENIPLVVPECNKNDILGYKKTNIISNPNCSTIQMVHILKPLDDYFDINRVDVSTYQAASGAGKKGMDELVRQMQEFFAFKDSEPEVFPQKIALNLFPHIDEFDDNGFSKEELKMINETHKIMHKIFPISATCVRVPILRSHSEAISIKFNKEFDILKVKEILLNAPNIELIDDLAKNRYPTPLIASGSDKTFVGRIRKDLFDERILHLFCSADQLIVGAGANAVKIAIEWAKMQE